MFKALEVELNWSPYLYKEDLIGINAVSRCPLSNTQCSPCISGGRSVSHLQNIYCFPRKTTANNLRFRDYAEFELFTLTLAGLNSFIMPPL